MPAVAGRFAGFPDRFARFDADVEAWWERNIRTKPFTDKIFYTASEVGDFGMIWLTIGTGRALLGGPDRVTDAWRLAAGLGIESALVNGPIKGLFRRSRPAWDQDRPKYLRQPKTSSFPSGHATSAVTAAILLTDRPTLFTPVIWAIAGTVATSRVHVKIHHGSDVVAGALTGVVFGLALRRLLPGR